MGVTACVPSHSIQGLIPGVLSLITTHTKEDFCSRLIGCSMVCYAHTHYLLRTLGVFCSKNSAAHAPGLIDLFLRGVMDGALSTLGMITYDGGKDYSQGDRSLLLSFLDERHVFFTRLSSCSMRPPTPAHPPVWPSRAISQPDSSLRVRTRGTPIVHDPTASVQYQPPTVRAHHINRRTASRTSTTSPSQSRTRPTNRL